MQGKNLSKAHSHSQMQLCELEKRESKKIFEIAMAGGGERREKIMTNINVICCSLFRRWIQS